MTGVPLVQPGVLEVVTGHVASAWAKKVGGILMGQATDEATRIEAALPARQTEEYAGEIAFPPSVWEEAYAKLDELPGSRIVGWYHSHPGSGVTLSEYDRRMHRALFGEPFNVALVLDPVADRMAWFGWELLQLQPEGEEQASGGAATVVPVGRGKRATAVALVVVRLAAVGAAGYWIGHETAPRTSSSAIVRSLTNQLAIERQRLEELRAELDLARQNLAAERDRLAAAQANLDEVRGELEQAKRRIGQLEQGGRPRTFVLQYHVRPGDTLWDLAATFLGNPNRWPEILRDNRPSIPDPRQLKVGQVLAIHLP